MPEQCGFYDYLPLESETIKFQVNVALFSFWVTSFRSIVKFEIKKIKTVISAYSSLIPISDVIKRNKEVASTREH